MATQEASAGRGNLGSSGGVTVGRDRLTDETKPAFKTTEFIAYIAVLVGVFIAGLVIKGADNGTDEMTANYVWLLATILTVGYMVSRGIAKSGSRHRYTDDDGRY